MGSVSTCDMYVTCKLGGRVLTEMVWEMRFSTLSGYRTSTWMAVASPPEARISLATVVMVEDEELGSGAVGMGLDGSLTVLAATTTKRCLSVIN